MDFSEEIVVPKTFSELVESVYQNYVNNKISKRVAENRKKLVKHIEKFHKEAGTLTEGVKRSIEDLNKGNQILIWSAHQPNFMPYSGIVRKITLMEAVRKRLIQSNPVINYFEITDQALPDRWVKETRLPSITSDHGCLYIQNPYINKKHYQFLDGYGDYPIKINSIPKPSPEVLLMWKEKIKSWLIYSLKSSKRLARKDSFKISFHDENLFRNTREFMGIIDESYEQAKNYADFNAFVLSKIVNNVWGYNTLFARSSEAQGIFKKEISSLLFTEYFKAMNNKSVSEKIVPFWYHCGCGGKVFLLTDDIENLKNFYGRCLNCNESYRFDVTNLRDDFFSNISLRATSLLLVYSKGLKPDLFVGGKGGLESYYSETKKLADKLKIRLPVIAIWNPYDRYTGIGQLHASLVFRDDPSKNNDEKLNNILNEKYSIIDYAINIGLRETSKQWISHLLNNGNLLSDVKMKSILDVDTYPIKENLESDKNDQTILPELR